MLYYVLCNTLLNFNQHRGQANMARIGVTFLDVSKAAEALRAHGQEPTVDRVREHLGTGSKSTIAPLLKRWREQQGRLAIPAAYPAT